MRKKTCEPVLLKHKDKHKHKEWNFAYAYPYAYVNPVHRFFSHFSYAYVKV